MGMLMNFIDGVADEMAQDILKDRAVVVSLPGWGVFMGWFVGGMMVGGMFMLTAVRVAMDLELYYQLAVYVMWYVIAVVPLIFLGLGGVVCFITIVTSGLILRGWQLRYERAQWQRTTYGLVDEISLGFVQEIERLCDLLIRS